MIDWDTLKFAGSALLFGFVVGYYLGRKRPQSLQDWADLADSVVESAVSLDRKSVV